MPYEQKFRKSTERPIRYTLGFLITLLALNAFAGGYYGMAGAENVPTEWLKGSPFRNYFIPSLILFICVGGSALIAAIAVFRRRRIARKAAFICGIITIVWLAVQLAIIGYVSWMQPTTAVAALTILFLTWQLPKYEH
jgi:peptidoglycan/LPS O-acetylase OafA/YrhL